jgi:hypothetical protein
LTENSLPHWTCQFHNRHLGRKRPTPRN